MYVPQRHSVDDDEAWTIVRDAGSGALIVAAPDGLASVFVPVVVSDDRRTMTSHLARANPWWRSVNANDEVLALFLVASAYVTPSYYPSRYEDPGVVPTWNYVAAEVRGRVRLHEEQEWKLTQVRAVTHQFEQDRDPAWRVDDLDESFRQRQLAAVVGVEIEVISIEGKAKLSQNRPEEDRLSVQRHFEGGTPAERIVAARMRSTD
ncbi:MAG TPA: FMN-binding negative transcriptional regulator [Acidimicrobiales bacterium]|nr:FMN-binding negative transcriptional regulator [Acidimicrobiales bacterium]